MHRKPRSYVGLFQTFVVLGVLVVFTCPGFAGVSTFYKWKDDQGKVHFTDDLLKIPRLYRSGPGLETKRGLPPPKSSPRKSQKSGNKESGDNTAEDQDPQAEKADDPKAKKKGKEVAAMRDALSFLKSDVQRFKKYEDYIPQHRHAILLRDEIVKVLPAKEALAKKLEKFDSTLLTQIRSFLKASLQHDHEAKKQEYPRRLVFIAERSRVNDEKSKKNSLIKKLTAKLASAPKDTSPNPPKPEEPPPPVKKEEPQKRRAYGGTYDR